MTCHRTDDACSNNECWVCIPIYCRFLGSETCRMGLNIAEHNLTSGGWEHPNGLDSRGYWAFGEEAVQ